MALEDRVAAYIGVGNVPGATDIDQFFADGVAKHLRYLTPQQQQMYASEKTDSGSGVDVTDSIVVAVHKSGYPSIEYPVSRKGQLADSDSIFEATTQSPAHIIDGGTLSVLPGGGTVLAIDYASVDADTDTEIDVLPDDLEDATVIFVAIQILNQGIGTKVDNVADTLSMPSAPTLTAYPSAPTLTVGSSSVTSTTIGALPSAPSYSSPSKPSLTTDISDLDTLIDDDDVEVAREIINKILARMDEYGADIQDAIAGFNANNADYQREVDRLIEQASITLQEEAKNADLDQREKIEQERLDLEVYRAEVESVARDNAELLRQYEADIQKEAARFQSKLSGAVEDVSSTIRQIENLRTEYQQILSPYIQQEAQ